jgi:FtsP/CotA-like multicopper oxidase with cupredoxin domain
MSKDDRSVLSWLAFATAIAGLCVALFGLRENTGSSAAGSGGAAAAVVEVHLKDFAFSPSEVSLPTSGGTIKLVNDGNAVHNFEIKDLGIKSPDVAAGTSYNLKVPSQAAGSYAFDCPQPGHADNGMKGTITFGSASSGSSATGGHSDGSGAPLTASAMDAKMLAAAQLYPAKTKGHGGDLMPFKVTSDGFKEFDVTAQIVDWEVEPGHIVKAWTYNGVVPAPEIHVNTGDKVRIVFKNALPLSTSLHFHGIQVPNVMDGVDPYTEAPTTPGNEHIYEFTAIGPAVGIYHSHHDAQSQIPDGMFGALTIDKMPIPQSLQARGYTPDKIKKTVNMVLNDAGVIGLSLNGKSFPATEPYTIKKGEILEVNYMNEGLLVHPMHMHQPMGWIIAKDGWPLDVPTPADTILVAPGERYTVLYMGMEPGVWAWHCHILTHAETPTGMRYMVTALIVER